MREKNWKSKPLFEKKKLTKPVKPIWPLQKGTITCSKCGTTTDVEAYAQLVEEFPVSKFWYSSGETCSGASSCGKLLIGWAIVETGR